MSIDQYSICPCGIGKKIKFCMKCKDSIHEMERVLKMVSGGQMAAALDKLNQILDEHPGAAWCLAIKGRLLLELDEQSLLAENAERFMRLQPSNPLALTQQAAALGIDGDLLGAAESVLNALAESSNAVDSFLLDVASVVSFLCMQQGNLLTARCFSGLALSAGGYENSRMASQSLNDINRSPEVSSLLKTVPTPVGAPSKPDVRERYDEASALLKANQVLLAQTKFDSLARQFPEEEAVLRGQLVCSVWRGDARRQAELLKKLSELESVDFETRARDLAISVLIQPDQPDVCTTVSNCSWEIEDIELVEQELMASEKVHRVPDEFVSRYEPSEEDGIPPRSVFEVLDRELPEGDDIKDVEKTPEVLATVMLFGKQTDRSASLELAEVNVRTRDEVVSVVQGLSGVSGEPKSEENQIPFLAAIISSTPMVRAEFSPAEAAVVQEGVIRRTFTDNLMATPLKILDGKTLEEVSDDDSYKLQRTAIVRILDSYGVTAIVESEIAQLAEKLGVSKLPEIVITNDEQLYSLPVDSIPRIKIDGLTLEQRSTLMQRAHAFKVNAVTSEVARSIVDEDVGADFYEDKLTAYLYLADATPDIQESLTTLAEGTAWADIKEVLSAPLLFAEIPRRLALGDAEGFQNAISQITTKYGDDPQVMTRLQQLLVGYGLLNPDGTPRQSPSSGQQPVQTPDTFAGPSKSDSGGLWTPDSPAAAPAGGESKIWLPGAE